jgi:hypothetical protein
MYSGGIFAERLFIEHHSHAPEPQRCIEAIRSLLGTVAAQHADPVSLSDPLESG